MLLALDTGNTSTTVGLFRGHRLALKGRIPTRELNSQTAGRYRKALRSFLASGGIAPAKIQAVILSSVVPLATVAWKLALKKLPTPSPIVLGETVRAPIVNRYRVPSQVGQDRLVNAVAAVRLYGGPVIVVDFGTAVTLDLISRRGEYQGGLIVPGVEVALEALSDRAALLPQIKLSPPREFLGRDTRSSMRSGIFHGYGALCDGLVRKLRSTFAPKAKVVATGGHAAMLAPYCRSIDLVNSDLTLQGLALIASIEKNC